MRTFAERKKVPITLRVMLPLRYVASKTKGFVDCKNHAERDWYYDGSGQPKDYLIRRSLSRTALPLRSRKK